jgi:ligand-binding sensor domain-containing protein
MLAPMLELILSVTTLAAGPQVLEVHTATRDVRDCLALDANGGGSYAAATDGGLVFLDEQGVPGPPLTALDGLPETRSYLVEPVQGSNDEVWVGTEGGLARVRLEAGGSGRVLDRFSSAPVRALAQHRGRTFVGTWGDGLLELRDGALVPADAPPGELAADPLAARVTALAVFDEELVVASAGAGAWTLGEHARPLDGVDGLVWSLAVHQGRLHAGTLAGVIAHDGQNAMSVSSHDARALASVDERLLVASRGQGLRELGDDEGQPGPAISHVQGLDGDRCLATPDGLWIRQSGGPWTRTLAAGLPSGDLTDLLRVGDRLYAASFERGVMVLEDGRWTALPDPAGEIDPQVNAIAPAGGDRIWIATARGLYRAGDGSVERWTKKQGLPHESVLSLAINGAGELVVGTHAGVAIVDGQGDVRDLGSRARSWATWAITEADDGTLWLGTTQGLIHWRRDGSWRHYSMLSGHLQDNWVTALLLEGDALHVGSYAGGVVTMRPKGEDEREGQWSSEVLGGGRVNPGGLALIDGKLHAATMKGLLIRERSRWARAEAGLFEDVTAALSAPEGLWIASRRGLELRAR